MRARIRLLLLGALLSCGLSLASSARLTGIGIAPTRIVSVTASPSTGTLSNGPETITVCFDLPVTIAGGVPTLPLDTQPAASAATYASASGTKCRLYDGVVTTTSAANPVATTSAGIVPNGATFTDANGYTPNLTGAQNVTVPGLVFAPGGSGAYITSITSSCSGTVSTVGTHCVLYVNFNTNVYVRLSWVPRLNLATAPVPAIAYLCDDVDAVRTVPAWKQQCNGLGAGNGTRTLNFGYILLGGQSASPVTLSSAGFDLNGATITNSAGVAANLTAANSAVISGLSFSPGGAYCLNSSSGSDSSSGLCPAAFATPARAQTAAQGGSIKTVFLETGTWGTGLTTCAFHTHNYNPSLGSGLAAATAYICQGPPDDFEMWVAYPGQAPVIDGGCPPSAGNTPNPGIPGCIFTAFESNGATGITTWGIEFRNFYGAVRYDYLPSRFTIRNNYFHDLYNTCGEPNGGDNQHCNGAEGAILPITYWSEYDASHNKLERIAGFGLSAVSGANGIPAGNNGFSMTLSYDLNEINVAATGNSDAGCIYAGWFPGNNLAGNPVGTGQITENHITNCGPVNTNADAAIYLDANATGYLIAGNIVDGTWTNATEISDGGANNLVTNNIIDFSQMGPWGNGQDLNHQSAPFYMPTGGCQSGYNCLPITQTNVSYTNNIIYGGGTFDPPAVMGVIPVNAGQPGAPTLGPNWYFTATGSFTYPPFCWGTGQPPAIGGGSNGICDPEGVLLSSNPFVDATAGTPGGYRLDPVRGAIPLANGFRQIALNIGLQ